MHRVGTLLTLNPKPFKGTISRYARTVLLAFVFLPRPQCRPPQTLKLQTLNPLVFPYDLLAVRSVYTVIQSIYAVTLKPYGSPFKAGLHTVQVHGPPGERV